MQLPTLYRSALVTGASRGIGAAICRELAGLGMQVHAVARSADSLRALCEETGAIAHCADVTDLEGMERLLNALDVDVLVNNAGQVAALGPLHDLDAAAIDSMIDVNLRAPLHLMRLVLPGMIRRGRGHIVNIGSTSGTFVFPGTAPYAAAKAGMTAANRVLRHDLAGRNIRVTEISPGRVRTDIYRDALDGEAGKLADMYDKFRTVHPQDIAAAVAAALTMPEQVDISFMEVVPTDQAPGGHAYAPAKS